MLETHPLGNACSFDRYSFNPIDWMQYISLAQCFHLFYAKFPQKPNEFFDKNINFISKYCSAPLQTHPIYVYDVRTRTILFL